LGSPPHIDVDFAREGGESSIAVFAINQQTGEPTAIQHADIRAAHPRTFGIDPGGRLLVAGSLAATAKREGGKVVDIPAGLSVFRMGADGKLDFGKIRERSCQPIDLVHDDLIDSACLDVVQ